MTDIVERLRAGRRRLCEVDRYDAADEIERLRVIKAKWYTLSVEYEAKIRRLRARVEELEDTIVALRRIAAEGDKASPYREARKKLKL